MTTDDIRQIEIAIDAALPAFYTATMLTYPFPKDSFSDEFLLMNDLEVLLRENSRSTKYPGIGKAFLIGGDGGEEVYFIDTASRLSQVFVYDMEKGAHTVKARDWSEYLQQVQKTLHEIEADERV